MIAYEEERRSLFVGTKSRGYALCHMPRNRLWFLRNSVSDVAYLAFHYQTTAFQKHYHYQKDGAPRNGFGRVERRWDSRFMDWVF